MGTQIFPFVPRSLQDEKHLSLRTGYFAKQEVKQFFEGDDCTYTFYCFDKQQVGINSFNAQLSRHVSQQGEQFRKRSPYRHFSFVVLVAILEV